LSEEVCLCPCPKALTSGSRGFGWGWLLCFFVCVALRFWGLSRFNTLVFDEVYYAKFANNYLTRTPFLMVIHP